MTTLERVVQILSEVTPNYMDEYGLQVELHDALAAQLGMVRREVTGSDGRSRFDLTVPMFPERRPSAGEPLVIVEVKVDGPHSALLRQITRYAHLPEVAAIVVVTTRSKHHHLPFEINERAVRLVSLIGAGL